jgi:hypothetical protein
MSNFASIEEKMLDAQVSRPAIEAFRRNFQALVQMESGMIAEHTIVPAQGLADCLFRLSIADSKFLRGRRYVTDAEDP